MAKKKVVVLATGGTIGSARGEDSRAMSGAMPGEALIEGLSPQLRRDVEVRSILMKPSTNLTLDDLRAIRQNCIEIARRDDVGGIVITHGTDTLEDTAFFLQQCVRFDGVPIVITGSQRTPFDAASDAYPNLIAAIAVARSECSLGLGVLVVFNESIFSANSIRKVSSFQLNGFASPGKGALGYVDGDKVVVLQRPCLPPLLPLGAAVPRVEIVHAYLDASETGLVGAAESGAAGVVIAGLGRGNVPESWVPVIRDLQGSEMPIWVTTECTEVMSLSTRYSFRGCLADLLDLGVVAVNDLSARQARLRLSIILSHNGKNADHNSNTDVT